MMFVVVTWQLGDAKWIGTSQVLASSLAAGYVLTLHGMLQLVSGRSELITDTDTLRPRHSPCQFYCGTGSK